MPSDFGLPMSRSVPGSRPGPVALAIPLELDSPVSSPLSAADGAPGSASPSARPKDLVDSYLRQLYGGVSAARALAAQALGALPSFLPRSQAPAALRIAVELGVVGSLADVLAADDALPVQEACLMALGSLLLATAPYEDHAAPLRPVHLRLMASLLLRPEVLTQTGYLLTATASSRVVMAAARVLTITAPYITQSNDLHVLDSRIVPSLLAAAAANPAPGARPAAGAAAAAPRDAAACVLALLALAQTTPDLYVAICTADVFQAVAVLYQRCIDPDQPSSALLPADAAALLLRAVTLAPNPRWAARLPAGYDKTRERHLEDCDALSCLVSYLAVEAANLRQLGADVATVAEGNARAVMEKNDLELKHLQSQQYEAQQQLAEMRNDTRVARRAAKEAEAEEQRARAEVEAADKVVQRARNGGSPEQRRARREAEAAATRAEEAVGEQRRAAVAAEEAVGELREEVTALRRAAAPLRWQRDRMAQLVGATQGWLEQYGPKRRSRVKVSRPNMDMLTQVLAYLFSCVKPPPAPERGARPRRESATLPAGTPSRVHLETLQAKLLEGGLVQAVVQLHTVLTGVRSLTDEVALLAGDLALQPDMAAALGGAAGVLTREAAALGGMNRRAELRLKQVDSEISKLRKALRLGFPQGNQRRHVELGAGNSLSREVRQEDVELRLMSLETEAEELTSVLQDSEALVEMLQRRLQAVIAASEALNDSHAQFIKVFPSQAAPSSPATAPAAGGDDSPITGPELSRALSLASQHIMAKDPSHPAGHLLGLLSRSLAPATHGSSNLAALIRQVQGRPPDGGGATWPPAGAAPLATDASYDGSRDGAGARPRSASSSRAVGRPRSARRPNAAGSGGGYGVAHAAGLSSRPVSARSSVGGVNRESFMSAGTAAGSPRSTGGYGLAFGATGYGGGFGGFAGFPGTGPFPTDAKGRPMRYPQESMYGIIQATHSPLRGYSAPSNGPGVALQLREKAAALRSSAGSRNGGGGGGGGLKASVTSMTTADDRVSASVQQLFSSMVSMPVADESRRVVQQAVSSVLFDPIDPEVLGPGVVRASAGSVALANGFGSRLVTAYGSRATTLYGSSVAMPPAQTPPEVEGSAAFGSPRPASGSSGAGGDMSVLDALLMQSELLSGVMQSLSALQHFTRSTSRSVCQLPSTVSYISVQPGSLGAFMAQLHDIWARAIANDAAMRVQITSSVAEIAELALVPPAEFDTVYHQTGMVEVLVQMLSGTLRPGKVEAKAGDSPGAQTPRSKTTDASSLGADPASGAGLKPRYVGRLTSTAPPTLRLGPAQQAEQAAASNALRAITRAQNEVLATMGQDEKLLSRLSALCLDHSMSWTTRMGAADLLADLVLGGGPAAEAAVANGAYAGLAEMLNRDMFPFLNQDPRSSKESVVSALACMVAHPELMAGVVAAAQAPTGPSAGMPLRSTDQVMTAILRSLWSVCQQVYNTFISDRTGHGRHVDPDMIYALTSTAATAVRELAVLADTVAEARRALNELGVRRKISTTFLQAIKDAPLHEALLELRKNLS